VPAIVELLEFKASLQRVLLAGCGLCEPGGAHILAAVRRNAFELPLSLSLSENAFDESTLEGVRVRTLCNQLTHELRPLFEHPSSPLPPLSLLHRGMGTETAEHLARTLESWRQTTLREERAAALKAAEAARQKSLSTVRSPAGLKPNSGELRDLRKPSVRGPRVAIASLTLDVLDLRGNGQLGALGVRNLFAPPKAQDGSARARASRPVSAAATEGTRAAGSSRVQPLQRGRALPSPAGFRRKSEINPQAPAAFRGTREVDK